MDTNTLIKMYGIKYMPDGQRAQIDARKISIPDFGVDDNAGISLIIRMSNNWSISVINITYDLNYEFAKISSEEKNHKFFSQWEIAFLYKNQLFTDLFLLTSFFDKTITPNFNNSVIPNLTLDQVNRIILQSSVFLKEYCPVFYAPEEINNDN